MFAQVRLVPAGPEKKPKRHLFGLLIVVGLLLLGGAAVMIIFQPGAPAPANRVTVSWQRSTGNLELFRTVR